MPRRKALLNFWSLNKVTRTYPINQIESYIFHLVFQQFVVTQRQKTKWTNKQKRLDDWKNKLKFFQPQ